MTTTLLFFAAPGLGSIAAFRWLVPWLSASGTPLHWAVFIAVWGPMLALASWVAIKIALSAQSAQRHLRVGVLTKRMALLSFGAFVGVQLFEVLLSPTRGWLAQLPGMSPGAGIPPIFRPEYAPDFPLSHFMGQAVPGNYALIFYWLLWLVVNIGGEELLWRGYALPRMERRFGSYAWLINGLLWNLFFHGFMPWSAITLLPISLVLPYLAQRTQSIWPGVIIHGTGNLLFLFLLVPSVAI